MTRSDLRIFKISDCSIVSVKTTQGISVRYSTEFKSSRCMNTTSEQHFSTQWCFLNKVSKSFNDTAIFAFPNLADTSSIKFSESVLARLSIARLAPA